MPGEWPLTGRAEELGFLDAAVRRSGTRGLVLAGPAGVGKTRLAREALARARARGARTWWAQGGVTAGTVPLGAFAELTADLEGDPTTLVARLAGTLCADPPPGGVIVGVDDAHLLDPPSALVVQRLVLRAEAGVVITVRSGEPAPDAVTGLWKDGHLDRLELQPLSEAETTRLLEAALGGPVDRHSARRLWSMNRGNTLFLRQLVEGERAAGRLQPAHGMWRWTGRPRMSPELTELVEASMGALPEPVQRVVDLLAHGEPLDRHLLAGLAGAPAIEDAENLGVVRVEPDGAGLVVRLAHPLFGESRRAAVGRLRGRRLRGELSTALSSTSAVALAGGSEPAPPELLRMAVLALDSDRPAGLAVLVAAARVAAARLDLPLAERLARAAVTEHGGFEAWAALGYALTSRGRGAEAEEALSTASESAPDAVRRLAVDLTRAGNKFFLLGRPAEAEALLDQVDRAFPGGPPPTSAMRAMFHFFLGRPEAAVRAGRFAVGAGELTDQAAVVAASGLVGGLGLLGRVEEAVEAAETGYQAAARSEDLAILVMGLAQIHQTGLRMAGELAAAAEVVARRRRVNADGTGAIPGLLALLDGYAAQAAGRLPEAIRWFREARAGLDGDVGGEEYENLIALTQALAQSGDGPAARATLTEARDIRHASLVFRDPDLILAQAWTEAAEGALSEAGQLARRAADVAADRGQLAHEVVALQAAVSFGDRTVADRLAALATRVGGPRAGAAAAHASALAADDGSALLAASERWERIGDLVAAADAAAQAALAHGTRDRRGSSATAAARAHELGRRCGAATPALRAAARPLPLTTREREIVTFAAQGLSNREIADRLVVSVRTVEGHLYRACGRLGVSNRADLAGLLGSGEIE